MGNKIMNDKKNVKNEKNENIVTLKSISSNPKKSRIILRKMFRANEIKQHVMKQKWAWDEKSTELKQIKKTLSNANLLIDAK
jgi:uncharacterized membrane protein YjjP (DUF1212 family)